MKRYLAAILSLLLALPLVSGQKEEAKRFQAQFLTLFDTVTTLIGYGGSQQLFTDQARLVYDELADYHRLYDIYHDYEGINNMKTVNDNAGIAPVRVDRRIIDLLIQAKAVYQNTSGRVNAAFGAVLSIWHDARVSGVDDPAHAAIPPMDLLRVADLHTDIGEMIIDVDASTVFLRDPAMLLDVGAMAKGFAAQRVAESARTRGLAGYLLSVGGNVCAIGNRNQTGEPWPVGVRNPQGTPSSSLFSVKLADGETLVTSGNYQRKYTVDGVPYHHIIDPDTLMPAAFFTAVSVISRDSGLADALSTALFNLPWEKGKKLAAAFPGVEVFWVLTDGTWQYSDGFKAKMMI